MAWIETIMRAIFKIEKTELTYFSILGFMRPSPVRCALKTG